MLTYIKSYEPNNYNAIGGGLYQLKDHDSLIIFKDNWFRYSQGYGGKNALDFLVKVRGMEFREAVQFLIDRQFTHVPAANQSHTVKIPPKEPLILPPPNKNNDAVYAYLRGRGIDKGIITVNLANGTIYENKRKNCVFVGYDGDIPKFACERGIADKCKRDIANSDKRFSFVMPPFNPNRRNLACFESPIDALSHDTIHKMNGDKWDGYRLSLGGVSSLALISFLERHTEIENIQLSLDNDKAGKEATDRIIKELLADKEFSHIKITVAPPPLGKDFNDTLLAIKQLNRESTLNRSKQADFLF